MVLGRLPDAIRPWSYSAGMRAGYPGAVDVGTPSTLPGKPQASGSLAGRVYVVDDDKGFLRSMDRLLRTAGYSVGTFTSAQEFLAADRNEGPACLLLDLRMPVVSGIDLQERLAASGEDIPIVFLSGHAEFQSGVRAMKAGAVDFLAKPFTEAELLAAVAKALEKDRGARAARVLKQDALERLARLTPRERQVCDLVATGLLNKQIAGELGAAEKTIKCHRGRVMEKLEVGSVAELVRLVDLARHP
jgi:FixJ family two-component response regulator